MQLKVGETHTVTLDEDKIFTKSVQFSIGERNGILKIESLDSPTDSMENKFSGGDQITVRITDLPDNVGNFVDCELFSHDKVDEPDEDEKDVNGENRIVQEEEELTPEKHKKPAPKKVVKPAPKKHNIDWIIYNGFFEDDEKEKPKLNLFDKFAEAVAESAGRHLSTNQVRNFYDAVKSIDNRINQSWNDADREDELGRQLPFIKMIKSRVAHASAGQGRIPEVFRDFMNDSIDKIKDHRDFEAFVMLFEAVTGWHSKYK